MPCRMMIDSIIKHRMKIYTLLLHKPIRINKTNNRIGNMIIMMRMLSINISLVKIKIAGRTLMMMIDSLKVIIIEVKRILMN